MILRKGRKCCWEALGLCKEGREGRDYIVCCRAYTTVAAAAGSIGIIGIGASIFLLFIIYLCAFICPI